MKLMELRGRHCRWPVGLVGGLDQDFCGAAARDGSSYCERHTAQAVIPTAPINLRELRRFLAA